MARCGSTVTEDQMIEHRARILSGGSCPVCCYLTAERPKGSNVDPQQIGTMLVGLTEIAQRAGVQKPVVSMWHTRHDGFPEPIAHLRTGAIWWWPDVQVWLTETNR